MYEKGDEDLHQVHLSFANTCHKLQGSEFDCVIVVVHSTHYYMLSREWLYTAMTRAKRTLILVGNGKGPYIAANNVTHTRRRTVLSYLLKDYSA